MVYIDEIKIFLEAGDGGDGAVSFRKEKYVEFGGPDGGNGGNGGSVILKVAKHLNNLADFRYKQCFKAFAGSNGHKNNKSGRSGKDLVITVPQGTQILSEDKKYTLYDLDNTDQEIIIIQGGIGGIGNSKFKSSRNQAPRKFTKGIKGNKLCIWLSLKILSDIGIVGLPNAGKSTFLSKITSAKPKISHYPFTTLTPQLGVVYHKHKELIIADIPGLVEKANLGYGLGTKFLKHLERCNTLLHIVDISSSDILRDYRIVREELKEYGNLMNKRELILLSKIDLLDIDDVTTRQQELEQHTGKKVMIYSSKSNIENDNIKKALFKIADIL